MWLWGEVESSSSLEGGLNTRTRGGVGKPTPPGPMKILSWNCRGLGSPSAVRALQRLIRLENFDLVFIMKSRLKGDEVP